MKISFSKMQGVGNDFVVINNLSGDCHLTPQQLQKIGDRRFGIGCDQILLVEAASDGVSDFFYRIYNSDGSEAGMCGNGARCFIRYVLANNLTRKSRIQLQTSTRIVSGQVSDNGAIEIAMGMADFTPAKIPLLLTFAKDYAIDYFGEEIEFSALSVGNPHVVIKLNSPKELNQDNLLQQVAVYFQENQIFPESVNVNFIAIKDGVVLLRTYERGCGFTLGCGSGACASAVIAIRDGLVESPAKLKMPGGELEVKWSGQEITLKGNAELVYTGAIDL